MGSSLALGLSMGLAAGITPGPLLALMVTSTLRWGRRAGVLAACVPLLTDAVVVVVALLTLGRLPPVVLPVLGVLGGVFVVWSGIAIGREARTSTRPGPPTEGPDPRSMLGPARQAAVVNLLSPHPWLFWITALGPLVIATGRHDTGAAVALVAGFYLTLVGAHVVVVLLAAGGRNRLSGNGYRRVLTGAAVLMCLTGLALLVEFTPQLPFWP